MNGVLGRLRGAAWTTVLLTIATIAVAAGR